MAVRHADATAKEVRFYFFNLVKRVESVFTACEPQARVAERVWPSSRDVGILICAAKCAAVNFYIEFVPAAFLQ